jgi:hypothetical protein
MSADLHDKGIGVMGIYFAVILSEAKDLMPVASGNEILRFAQDDNYRHPQPATNVSATNVFGRPKWPALIALIALTPGTYRHAMRRPCAVDEKPPAEMPEIPETLKIEICGATPAGGCVDAATLHGGDGPFCSWSEPWPS